MPSIIAELGHVIEKHLQTIGLLRKPTFGGGLLAAFPLAYAVMLPALYIPIILMLIGLILRGVAFEFRFKSERSRWMWDTAFAGGSLLAALMQGVIIGATPPLG